MDRQGGIEKENKTLGTERCENIDTLYTNNFKKYLQHLKSYGIVFSCLGLKFINIF